MAELKLQIELALVQKANKAATAQHAQLIAERAVHTGLLPYDLWLAGNKSGRKSSKAKVRVGGQRMCQVIVWCVFVSHVHFYVWMDDSVWMHDNVWMVV